MEFEANEAYDFDQFISVNEGMAIFFLFLSCLIFKGLWSDPQIDVDHYCRKCRPVMYRFF